LGQAGDLPPGIGEGIAEDLRNFRHVPARKEVEIKRSWMPYGKILIVDDLPVNLKIARGLLEPYGLLVDSAESGQKAIELIKAENPRYDLVFMDHIMPEMDGVETVRIIRKKSNSEYCKNVPIVALTANALMGNMEMFMSREFNGYISKPIDIVQLDDALNRWVRDRQSPETLLQAEREKVEREMDLSLQPLVPDTPFPAIPGVDVQYGVKMTGGTVAAYRMVLSVFYKDTEKRLPLFLTPPDADTLPEFITKVHALKSASASIGAADIPAQAAELEAAGKDGDLAFIRERLNGFAEQLSNLLKNIREAMQADAAYKNDEKTAPPDESHGSSVRALHAQRQVELLGELKEALQLKKPGDIDLFLEQLTRQAQDAGIKEALEKISDEVLMNEYENALKIVKEILGDGSGDIQEI
jgi:CheY-like chemotaxis protein